MTETLAYTDPGSGSMLPGMLLIGLVLLVLAVSYAVKHHDRASLVKLGASVAVALLVGALVLS